MPRTSTRSLRPARRTSVPARRRAAGTVLPPVTSAAVRCAWPPSQARRQDVGDDPGQHEGQQDQLDEVEKNEQHDGADQDGARFSGIERAGGAGALGRAFFVVFFACSFMSRCGPSRPPGRCAADERCRAPSGPRPYSRPEKSNPYQKGIRKWNAAATCKPMAALEPASASSSAGHAPSGCCAAATGPTAAAGRGPGQNDRGGAIPSVAAGPPKVSTRFFASPAKAFPSQYTSASPPWCPRP